MAEGGALGQGGEAGRRVWAAWAQLGCGVDFGAGWHIDGEQFSFVEIQDFAQFLGELQAVVATDRFEVRLVADPHDLVRVGVDVSTLGDRQAKRRRTEQVGDKAMFFTVPSVEVRAGAGRQNQLGEGDGFAGLHLHIEVEKGEVEPAGVERMEQFVFANADLDGQRLDGTLESQARGDGLDLDADTAGVGAVAVKANLELLVSVASVVAEIFQAGGVCEQQVGVAVAIDVGGGKLGDLAGERVEAKRSADMGEAANALVAKRLQAVADGEDIEPAVVVVINEADRGDGLG